MKPFLFILFTFLLSHVSFSQTNFEKGLEAFDKGNFEEAIQHYSKNIKTNHSENAFYNRALAYYEIGKNLEAIEDFTIVLDIDPKDHEAWNNRALAYYEIGEINKAIFDAKKSISLEPTYASAYTTLGVSYQAKKNNLEAIKYYNLGLELEESALLYYNRGLVYEDLKQYQKAESDYSQAINLEEDADYYWARANLFYKNDNFKLSIEDYNKALRIQDSIPSLYYNRGLSFYSDFQDQKAIEDFTIAYQLDSNDIDSKWYLALCNYQLENYEKALDFYNKVEKQDAEYQYLNQLDKKELINKTKIANNLLYILALIVLAFLAFLLISKLFFKKESAVKKIN